jgi:hypothetical protein
MDINLILLMPNSMMIGWQYYEPEEAFDFYEFNLSLVFVKLNFKWGQNL